MPIGDKTPEWLETLTGDLHLISQYTLMDFEKLLALDCVTYRKLFKDAFITKFSGSEEGRDYLEQCWILTQTTPDYKRLREFKEKK